MSTPTIYGVGVGPGAPDLMSVRAARLVGAAKVVAYFRKAGRPGHARRIADGLLPEGVIEEPMDYPVTTEIALDDPAYAATLRSFYEQCVSRLAEHIAQGRDVVVLCEGDPFLYGSFMHLHSRLAPRVPVEVVPGISGMAACWTASGTPITYGDDVLCVVPATLGPARLKAALAAGDAIVIMKLGRNLPKVRRALDDAGLLDRAIYVERGAMDDQVVMPLADKTTDDAPYFSIVLVHGQGRRP
ncbi:precorrin-2 C(20)-methyltransferase [Rhodopseudomonas sp.]|uniref:precorrin-2 C(20)-methyltransferase n=1 Tax=Rhodopseudomonas sp. TaxID=1078 RepID=UPI0039E4A777